MAARVAVGCGDGDAEPREESNPDPSPTEVALGASYATCVHLDGKTEKSGSVDGVRWSVLDRPELPGLVTAADGCFQLSGLPLQSEVAVTWTKPGYIPRLRALRTGTGSFTPPLPEWIVSLEGRERFVEWSGFQPPDPTRGTLSVLVTDTEATTDLPFLRDLTIEISPPPEQTCYLPDAWLEDGWEGECASAESNIGVVSAFDVEEGPVEVTIGPDAVHCDPIDEAGWGQAWPIEGRRNAFRTLARAGYQTFVNVRCWR